MSEPDATLKKTGNPFHVSTDNEIFRTPFSDKSPDGLIVKAPGIIREE